MSQQSRRVNTLAWRLSNAYLLRLVFVLLLVQLVLLFSLLASQAYQAEKAALGSAWRPDLLREFYNPRGDTWYQAIPELGYQFSLPGQEVYTFALGPSLLLLSRVLSVLLPLQGLLVFLQYRSFYRRAMHLLRPLRDMATTAEELSRQTFSEQHFHSLEDAIDSLSVQIPGARLKTGNSELQGLENAVNNLVARMHASYHQQNRFVSDASHELRTPIAVIRGYADLLSRWGMDDRKVMEESVAAIRDEADNMQRLVEQLLFLARGDLGRTDYEPKPLDLAALVQEVHEEYTLIDPEHRWRLKAAQPVPALGDEAMLKQALRILADNAKKFSPKGSVITLSALLSDQGLPSLAVQDNGQGISKEDLPHIFERFYRSDPARGKGGTGLGLSIASWIAQRHQGHIQVFSSEGLGTRFTLALPAQQLEGDKFGPGQQAREKEGVS